MLKKAISLILSLCLLVSVTSAFAASFSDVTSSYSWAEEAIKTLADNQVITGYPDGTFKPGNNITKEEAIALFARILGANEPVNKSVVSLSNVLFEDSLASYNTYAKEAAAYLMYKKVLTADELSIYLSASNKGETLKRYEAATLIAKCLGGDVWLKSNPDITLSYADASDVPAAAKGYVYFASAAQIIQGMDNNQFVPMGNVTRAQVAVMLHRMHTRLQYSYLTGTIAQVNSATNIISIRDEDGEQENYKIDSNVAVMLDGKQSQLSALPAGQKVIVTFSNGGLYSLDVVVMKVDDSFEAVYRGKTTDSTGTTVKFVPVGSEEMVSYKLADDAVIVYNGQTGSINSISPYDYAKVSVVSGKVTSIEAETRSQEIVGARVESITFEPDVLVSLRLADNTLASYPVKSGATIRRNGAVTSFSELVVGDKVDVKLDYGQISNVVAIGVEKKVTGTIEEITIAKNNSVLKVNVNGAIATYSLSRDASIKLDDAAATIYDLRLGYQVELTTSSATITAVEVKSVSTPLQITGQIVLINTAWDMLTISYQDTNGNVIEEQVFVKEGAKILDSNDGKIKKLSDLKVGQNITVAGVENVGIFEVTSIMILTNTTN